MVADRIATIDRLRQAISAHSPATPRAPVLASEPPPIASLLRGEWHETAAGRVFARDEWFALDHAQGSLPLGAALTAEPAAIAQLAVGGVPDVERLAFFDIETTGLSGGTGTYVVLAGLGSYERQGPGDPPAFRLRQYFLADLASEHAMLTMLAADIARFEGIVTYNGRSFDVPLLETRLALARLRSPCDGMPHLDLLHAVRRLYRHRMPGCRLSDAERRLLRIERIDDLSGSLIPAIYFDYLRAGRVSPLRAVFRHNAEDVLSLVGILASLATALAPGAQLPPDDAVAVARWWERAGQPLRSLPLYEEALPWLDGGPDWGWSAARLAALHKRAGRAHTAVPLWRKLWAGGDQRSGLELAKHLEHRERDCRGAAAITETLLAFGSAKDQPNHAHRLARLRRKLADAAAC